MAMEKRKRLIIIEGPDMSGKTTLCKMIQDKTEGKCHTLHSNYDKNLTPEAHWHQHELYWAFAHDQFLPYHYSGNHTVIFDRCYFSDLVYGQIGYGSPGDMSLKWTRMATLASMGLDSKLFTTFFIYCKPSKRAFGDGSKEELLTSDEDSKVAKLYDDVINCPEFLEWVEAHNITYMRYDFTDKANIQSCLANMWLV